MSDVFSVQVTLNGTVFTAGASIVATLSGNDVQTTTTNVAKTYGPFTGQVVAADGATAPVSFGPFTVNTPTTVATPQSVKWDTTVPIVDPSGRVWTFGADGLTLTATA
jgi:hypothetical protein